MKIKPRLRYRRTPTAILKAAQQFQAPVAPDPSLSPAAADNQPLRDSSNPHPWNLDLDRTCYNGDPIIDPVTSDELELRIK